MSELKSWLKSYSILKEMNKPYSCSFPLIIAGAKGLSFLENELIKIYKNYFSDEILKYQNHPFHSDIKSEMSIWVCWWQGEKAMPPLVRNCFKRLKLLNPDTRIVLVTKDNYSEYVDIPEHVVTLLQENKITITFFSDYLRAGILSKHGGLWIDASTYIVRPIFPKLFFGDFISQRSVIDSVVAKQNIISEARWAAYFLGSEYSGCVVFQFLKECLEKILIEFHYNPYYFSIDLIIRCAYDGIPCCKPYIDTLIPSSPDVHLFSLLWNKEFSEGYFKELCARNDIFKLNSKWHAKDVPNSYHEFFTSCKAVDWDA